MLPLNLANRSPKDEGAIVGNMTDLWQLFVENEGNSIHQWDHYFPAYQLHLERFKNRPMRLLEIGVFDGGSLQMWKKFLGPHAQIVGIDIEDKSALEESQISIRTGDQADEAFLQSVLDEFGAFDAVIDDGSHKMHDLSTTFRYLYPRMAEAGVYIVEDLHTCYWEEYDGAYLKPESFLEISKSLVDELNADHTRGAVEPTPFSKTTLSMHFYDSMVVFEKGHVLPKRSTRIGIPVTDVAVLP